MGHRKRVWRTVSIALALPGMFLWIGSLVIWSNYQQTHPRTPDPKVGRIYPENIHGIVVYQTYTERYRLKIAQCVSVIVFLLGALISALEEKTWEESDGKNIPPMPRGWEPPTKSRE